MPRARLTDDQIQDEGEKFLYADQWNDYWKYAEWYLRDSRAPVLNEFAILFCVEEFFGGFNECSGVINQRKIDTGFDQFTKVLWIPSREKIDPNTGIP